jgi:predicted ABC-type ATPase
LPARRAAGRGGDRRIDVPDEKLEGRFHRTLANLQRAIQALPVVVIFDNTDLSRPYRLEAIYVRGQRVG